MITRQKQMWYFVGDKPYASLEEAQKADLMLLLEGFHDEPSNDALADWLLKNAPAIVDTLTTSPRSRLRGRKLHGAIRKRKGKPLAEAKGGQEGED